MADEKKPTVVQPQTVTRVYLKPPDLNKFSMWHTAYVGEAGNSTQLHRFEIVGGQKRGVPLAEYERFRDAGILTTERPKRAEDDD